MAKISLALLPVVLLALVQTSCASQASLRPPLEKPNVVIFYLDDSGYGDFSYNGNPTIGTPTIDRLAREGVSFTQFYTTSPACSASRYSLLTGRYPGRSGLGRWVVGPEDERHIHTREITIAEGLQDLGYKTAMFGKWHLGTPNQANNMSPDSLPLAHGFDEWTGTDVSHDYATARLLRSSDTGTSPVAGYEEIAIELPTNIEVSESLTEIYTSSAIDFIDKNKAAPFFAYIAFNQPHLGLHASPEFVGKSRRGLLGDVMAEIDHSVARIMDAIRDAGIENNTLVIFSSDNGPWIKFQYIAESDYGDARLDVGYALPFRDGKGSNWEGGHRVPGIFYWPGVIEAGVVEQSPVSTLDVLPTVFALTGASKPDDRSIDGRDISSCLTASCEMPDDPFEFVYSLDRNNITAVRVGPWKLVTSTYSQTGNDYGFSASREHPLLFQVEQDLLESIDRADEQPEIVNRLNKVWIRLESMIRAEGTFWDN